MTGDLPGHAILPPEIHCLCYSQSLTDLQERHRANRWPPLGDPQERSDGGCGERGKLDQLFAYSLSLSPFPPFNRLKHFFFLNIAWFLLVFQYVFPSLPWCSCRAVWQSLSLARRSTGSCKWSSGLNSMPAVCSTRRLWPLRSAYCSTHTHTWSVCSRRYGRRGTHTYSSMS